MAVLVGQQGAVWTRIARDRDDIVRQQGAVWTRIARDRERWRTLAEGYFLQWKATFENRTDWNRVEKNRTEQYFTSVPQVC